MAVPTTSIESSCSRILGISLRIRAESSTTSTRNGFLMPALPPMPRARISEPSNRCSRGTTLDSRPAMRGPVTSARPRVKRSISAIMLRIRTTRPSPRIEAPLTRSVVIDWSSSALMTNSSSPSSPSTMTPNLRSPLLMTSTKILRRAVSGLDRRFRAQAQQRQARRCAIAARRNARPGGFRLRRCARSRPPRSAAERRAAPPPGTSMRE